VISLKSTTPLVHVGDSHQLQTGNTKAFLCRSLCSCFCPPELSELTEHVEAADDKLFQLILRDIHILSSLLPPKSDSRYNLHKKYLNREILLKNTHFYDCNFIVRLLCKDYY